MNCSKCNVGIIQKTSWLNDDNSTTTAYVCNKCSHGWAETYPKTFNPVTNSFDLEIELEHFKKIIATGLNVQKELESMQYASLAQQMTWLDAETLRQVEQVKSSIAEMAKRYIKEHQCLGVVPNTFIVCGEDDYQYCSSACMEIARRTKELK
jgi:hypothetical protein